MAGARFSICWYLLKWMWERRILVWIAFMATGTFALVLFDWHI